MRRRQAEQSGATPRREVYFEFHAVGGSVRVTAIDSGTGVETSVIGPARAAQSDLEKIALRKLMRTLEKKEAAVTGRPGFLA